MHPAVTILRCISPRLRGPAEEQRADAEPAPRPRHHTIYRHVYLLRSHRPRLCGSTHRPRKRTSVARNRNS